MAKRLESLELGPKDATVAISHCVARKMPLFLWGPPGIGKSQIMAQIAESLDMEFVDIRLSQMDPTDLRGMPYPTNEFAVEDVAATAATAAKILIDKVKDTLKGEQLTAAVQATVAAAVERVGKSGMRWAPPSILPSEPDAKVLILLDEMNAAAPSIQHAAYQLVLDRRLGEYILPENCVVMAAGNRDTDRDATFKMAKPLQNRFIHITLRTDFDDWQEWALMHGISQHVVGYLNWQKQELFEFDAKSASNAFPTPRSWEFVSKLISDDPNLPEMVLLGLIAGAVGDGAGTKFIEYRKKSRSLPNPSDILAGKIKDLKNKETSICYALTTGLCYELKDGYEKAEASGDKAKMKEWYKMSDCFLTFMMKNFIPEMVILGARTALALHRLPFEPSEMKSWDEFSAQYQDLILKA